MNSIERFACKLIDAMPISFYESRISMIPYYALKYTPLMLLDRRCNIRSFLADAIIENSDHLD
jgi:hypothetical protein